MDDQPIERSDFRTVRRGYDPVEVDAHLRQVGAEVRRLREAYERSQTLSGAAAGRVQAILEAAERSATELEETRSDEARRILEDAEARARELVERAEVEAAGHLERVEEAAVRIMERVNAAEGELTRVLEGLRDNGGALVDDLRSGAESIQTHVAAIHTRVAEVSAGPEAPTTVDSETDPYRDAASQAEADEFAEEDTAVVETMDRLPEDETEPVAEGGSTTSSEGARLIALNMALNGSPREETAAYLSDNFDLPDQDALLDEVYSRAGG